ncbi:MAG TPA: glycosyltransferase [candidate division Zixibacteria bacterium]|nr:glycosyltransferase [candidate division Zixibacteria bacterium]
MTVSIHIVGVVLAVIAAIFALSSTVVLVLALIGARRFRKIARQQQEFEATLTDADLPFVSLLKPLHGTEPQLEENLESFFNQDYPDFEVLFAVDHEDDAAIAVAQRVMDRHPERHSQIIVQGEPPWPNPPAFGFHTMAKVARAEILVTSDSDVIVERNYLRQIVPPLLHKNTGMLTCVYRGLNTGGFWSQMDAIGMSVEMTAGVVMANWMEGMRFGLGPTIVVRRDALEAIGGYAATGEYFSNDFIIGHLIAEKGYHVELSRNIIAHVVPPMSFERMWQRQVRWAAGTRRSRPMGHLGTVFVYAVPGGILAAIAGVLLGHPLIGLGVLGWSIVNRMIESLSIGWGITRDRECLVRPWLYPMRDLLGFAVWVASYLHRKITWRNGQFELIDDGRVRMRDREGRVITVIQDASETHEMTK